MKQTAVTPEKYPVIAGVGSLCFSKGVPLEIVLTFFQSNNYVVDWCDYMVTAINDGHNPRTIRARIDSAVTDVYGKVYAGEVLARVDKVLEIFA